MPIYVYKGYDSSSGDKRKGKVEADSVRAARQKLKKDKIIASDLKEEVALQDKGSLLDKLTVKKVTLQDLAIASRQLATLQQAHVPLDECLLALTGQVENKLLSNTFSALRTSVSEGKSLGESMQAYPDVFNRLYVNMVKAGESSGKLGHVLEELSDFLEYQLAVKGKLVSALTYPVIMIVVSIGIIGYLFLKIVPSLEKVFLKLNVALPPLTQLVLNFSNFLQDNWLLLIIGGAGATLLFKVWHASPAGRLTFDGLSLKAPLVGAVLVRLNVSNFTKTLSTLLSAGVPIITALEITRNIISNRVVVQVLEDAKTAVQEGEALWLPIDKSKVFPSLVTYMIRTGEKTGELEPMLKHVAEAYDVEVERKIDSMIAAIEPIMLIVMGGVVLIVVIALLVPMLDMMNQVR